MDAPEPHEVTRLLHAAQVGDDRASSQLLPIVYDELRRAARDLMRRERGQTLQPTALVHEAFLRLLGPEARDLSWDSRRHFFGAAALAMRRILVERARRRDSLKRGGGQVPASLDEEAVQAIAPEDDPGTDLVALDESLDELARYDQRKAEVVMLRYFAGLTFDEIAVALDASSATVRRDWTFARAWLLQQVESRRAGPDR